MKDKEEKWITAKDASLMLTKQSGRPVIQQYVRDLARQGKIKWKPFDGRTNLYLKSDVEKLHVKQINTPARKQKNTLPETNVA